MCIWHLMEQKTTGGSSLLFLVSLQRTSYSHAKAEHFKLASTCCIPDKGVKQNGKPIWVAPADLFFNNCLFTTVHQIESHWNWTRTNKTQTHVNLQIYHGNVPGCTPEIITELRKCTNQMTVGSEGCFNSSNLTENLKKSSHEQVGSCNSDERSQNGMWHGCWVEFKPNLVTRRTLTQYWQVFIGQTSAVTLRAFTRQSGPIHSQWSACPFQLRRQELFCQCSQTTHKQVLCPPCTTANVFSQLLKLRPRKKNIQHARDLKKSAGQSLGKCAWLFHGSLMHVCGGL